MTDSRCALPAEARADAILYLANLIDKALRQAGNNTLRPHVANGAIVCQNVWNGQEVVIEIGDDVLSHIWYSPNSIGSFPATKAITQYLLNELGGA